jgi:hypothetical protein
MRAVLPGAAGERDCPALHEEYWRLLPVRNTAGRTAVASVVALGAYAQMRRIDPDSSACGKALISGI